MKRIFSAILLLLILSLSGTTLASDWKIESPWSKSGTDISQAVLGDTVTLDAVPVSIHTFDEANWNEDDVTWTMTGTGPLVHVAGNTTTVTATNTEAIVAGTTYRVTITGTGGGGTATYTLGGVTGTTIAASGAIAITDYITASTTGSMIITPASACTVSITNIAIEKLTDATGDLTVQGDLFVGSTIKSPGGSGGINILPSGNVGIRTVPEYVFQVGPSVGTHMYFDGSNTLALNRAGIMTIENLGTGGDLSLRAADFLNFLVNYNTEVIRIISSGNVGINHTSPQSNLDVINTIRITDFYTDASNYEGYSIDAGVTTADTLTIKGITAGTGADNLNIALVPAGTGAIKVPTGLVGTPAIIADDADSGFYFGSKGFNWSVDGAKKFGVDVGGEMIISGALYINGILALPSTIYTTNTDTSLILQTRAFTAADNMVEMATGTTTFTGFDGEIAGVAIIPTVGIMDAGDTMTLLKLAPQGTPASTLGVMRALTFGNWGGTGTDTANMIDMSATGYDNLIYSSVFNVDNAGTITNSGARIVNVTTVNAATYDLLTTDDILNVTYTTTGAVTSLTLPTAQLVSGRIITVKDAGYNAGTFSITIDTEGAEKINNGDTYVINANGNSVSIYSDGTNWHIY